MSVDFSESGGDGGVVVFSVMAVTTGDGGCVGALSTVIFIFFFSFLTEATKLSFSLLPFLVSQKSFDVSKSDSNQKKYVKGEKTHEGTSLSRQSDQLLQWIDGNKV